MDPRDTAYLKDFYNFAVSNHTIGAAALYRGGAAADDLAVGVHVLEDGLEEPAASEQAKSLGTPVRVQAVVVAKILVELMAAVEDCGALALAIRERDLGLMKRYVDCSTGEVAQFLDHMIDNPGESLADLLRLPAPSAAPPALQDQLAADYRELEERLRNAASAYRQVATDEVTSASAGAPWRADPDQIAIVLAVDDAPKAGEKRSVLVQALNKTKHRFTLVEHPEALVGAGAIRVAHHSRKPESVGELMKRVASVSTTTAGLAATVLQLEDLDLV